MPNSLRSVPLRINLALKSLSDNPAEVIGPFLNGHAAHSIDRMLSRERRRKDGIFFSGACWSKRLIECVGDTEIVRWCDPAAGTGDLLLEAATRLPLKEHLSETLRFWSRHIIAGEKNALFLDIAWQRIRALAVLRHFERDGRISKPGTETIPASFVVGDSLSSPLKIRAADCVVMNPPYTHRLAPPWCQTSTGRVSTAALFLERYITNSPVGTRIVALLPDVIRSGTRYRALRRLVHQHTDVELFAPQGAFSADADVDVSMLTCTVGTESKVTNSASGSCLSVGDFFHVRVGNVVPHRTPTDGPANRYLTARGLPDGGILSAPTSSATFNAPVYRAPFVVVRRTSSPSDRVRTRATFVPEGDYLIENHLIVCLPKPNVEADCNQLLSIFANPRTNDWMNERIRCRHLTTEAIKELPAWI